MAMKVPTDYIDGYARARLIAPEMADNYIAHASTGDPLAEAMTDDLAEMDQEKARKLVQAAMDNTGEDGLRDAPASVREFFKHAATPPDWLDYAALAPGVRLFYRHSQTILAAFVAGVLIEGFTKEYREVVLHHRPGARPGHQGVGSE